MASKAGGKYIALLRAVNLGGHNRVSMAELRGLLGELGLQEAQSLLVSGNLVFASATAQKTAALETRLESAASTRLGLTTDFFVRTAAEWERIIAGNPFPAQARQDPGHLVVVCLKDAPVAQAATALQAAAASKGREQIQLAGRTLYVTYPDGIGRSKLTAAVLEKHLDTSGTGRNWNTVRKLAALAGV